MAPPAHEALVLLSVAAQAAWAQNIIMIASLLQALPDACQALYMRLHQRVGPWFRTATLEYSEVADMPATVQQLADAGFAARLDLGHPAGLRSLAEVSLEGSQSWEGFDH